MTNRIEKEYCFVMDSEGKPLAPTSINRGWYLIRKGRAKLVEKFPVVIQLHKIATNPICDMTVGIDDGSKYVGVALLQKCDTKNKCVLKGIIEQRQDVKKLMTLQSGYRRQRRQNKRYRKARFDNRANSKRNDRVPPTILQKKQTILRFLNKISKWISISKIVLEDVAIDIRVLTQGYQLDGWQYQKSNRLDENLRKATVMRDRKCKLCGKQNCKLQVHHILPRRMNGADTLQNLITLCVECHNAIKDKELEYVKLFQKKIEGKQIRLDDAQHVMQGKHWLRDQLGKIAPLEITDGGTTANNRMEWNMEKSHSNDAIAITGLYPNISSQQERQIYPKRKKTKMKCNKEICGLRHGDYVTYTDKKGMKWFGYITAMYYDKLQINVQCLTKHLKRVNAKKSTFVCRYPQMSII